MKKLLHYFSRGEWILWTCSVSVILVSYAVFDGGDPLTIAASLVGVTALIFNAKGNPFGQILMIAFSIQYSVISFSFAYYGELATWLGMSAPMAVLALIAWLRNPYKGDHAQVEIQRLCRRDLVLLTLCTIGVTAVFYVILGALHTTNLLPSTISVTTSFTAAWLTVKRSPYFAAAYAVNDVVLIVLWLLASQTDLSYLSVLICFVVFLVNDLYGFISWRKMQKKQECAK